APSRPKPGRSRLGPVWPNAEMRTITSERRIAESASHPRLQRSSVPGLKFSASTCHARAPGVRAGRSAQAPQVVADAWLLHLDHLGAELAEQRRADRRRQVGREIEDANGVERTAGVGHGDHLTCPCYDSAAWGGTDEEDAGAG